MSDCFPDIQSAKCYSQCINIFLECCYGFILTKKYECQKWIYNYHPQDNSEPILGLPDLLQPKQILTIMIMYIDGVSSLKVISDCGTSINTPWIWPASLQIFCNLFQGTAGMMPQMLKERFATFYWHLHLPFLVHSKHELSAFFHAHQRNATTQHLHA